MVKVDGKYIVIGILLMICIVLAFNPVINPQSTRVTAGGTPSVDVPQSPPVAKPPRPRVSGGGVSTSSSAAPSTLPVVSTGVPTSSAPRTLVLNKVYHKYFQEMILDEMGPYVAGALYDPSVLLEAMKSPGFMAFVNTADTSGMPATLNTPYAQIADIKRAASIGLGRMHRDSSMQVLFDKSTPVELAHFDRSVRHFVRGVLRGAVLKIQTIVDFGPARAHLGPKYAKRMELFEGHDPVWAFLNAISTTATEAEIKDAWDTLGSNPKAAPENPVHLHPAEQLFHIEYHIVLYKDDTFKHLIQKYMYLWRPTASCFDVQRECESPDGCRYYCNYAYLQRAADPSLGGKPYYHRFLGFGSNNEYEWEQSMLRYMGYKGNHVFNKLHTMTSFDCTLPVWRPPQELKNLPVGWGGASFCVGDRTGKIGGRNFVAFSEMKQRILESETPGTHATVLRNKMEVDHPIPVNTEYFDEVSILKCDIEGSEVPVMYTWSNGELSSFNNNKNLQKQIADSKKDNEFLMIDFAKIIPEYFTVSTVLMEIHGWGPKPLDIEGVFRTQHLLQQLSQMGYVPVSLEANFNIHTAFEVVYVHYRYFVRSEMWSHLRGNNIIKKSD